MVLIDSAGVEVLTRVSAWTRRKGGELVLRSVSPALAEQLELARRAQATGATLRSRPLTGPRPGNHDLDDHQRVVRVLRRWRRTGFVDAHRRRHRPAGHAPWPGRRG